MKMKKVLSFILSLSTALGALGAMPAQAAGSMPDITGHNFIDIAHHGNTYVAMSKDTGYKYANLYTSTDGGVNWTRKKTNMDALISGNKESQQQLVYWADKGVFVAHGSKTSYTSEDGLTWTENANIHWSTNTYLTAESEYLLLAGGSNKDSSLNAQDDLTKKQFGDNKFIANDKKAYILHSVAAKPKDKNGDIYMFAAGKVYQYYVKMTPGTPKCSWKTVNSNVGGAIPTTFVDMIYAKGADQFLAVVDSGKLYAAKDAQNFGLFDVKDGATVTGIAASDSVIVAGLSDGSMYYTNNAEITSATEWTEIPAEEEKTAASEPIKNIEFSDDGQSFVALGKENIYKGDLSGYCNIKEYTPKYLSIGEATVKPTEDKDMFKGIKLIGGSYSETLGKYIVYGNTTTADSDGKYYGKIFTSYNAFDWENTYTGVTFSDVRNGSVWWESQKIFIVSASNQENFGVSVTSTDGKTWTEVKGYPGDDDAEGTVYTGLALNADIRIAGGNLYTTDGNHKLMKYTAWDKNAATEVADVSKLDNLPKNLKNINQIALSDEENPAVLMAQNYLGVVRNNESTAEKELDKWSIIRSYIDSSYPNALGIGNGDLTDAVYSKNLGKFVAIVNKNLRTVIVPKAITDNDKAIQGPVVSGVICNAIDTNDSVFMLTGPNGKIYTAPDSGDFKPGYKLGSNVVAAATAEDEITYDMINVFKTSGDRFIAIASDKTNSAVAVIDKSANGSYEYKRAALPGETTLTPGEGLTVSVDVDNQMPGVCNLVIIAAIYSGDSLKQAEMSAPLQVASYTSETKTLDIQVADDIEADSQLRIFVWNGVDGMKPLRSVSYPFN